MANLGEATGTGAPPDASALQQQIQEMAQNQANMQTQMQNMMQAMTTLNQQLTQAQQRAEAAEKERADALRLAVAKLDHTDIVDAKGVLLERRNESVSMGCTVCAAGYASQLISEGEYLSYVCKTIY